MGWRTWAKGIAAVAAFVGLGIVVVAGVAHIVESFDHQPRYCYSGELFRYVDDDHRTAPPNEPVYERAWDDAGVARTCTQRAVGEFACQVMRSINLDIESGRLRLQEWSSEDRAWYNLRSAGQISVMRGSGPPTYLSTPAFWDYLGGDRELMAWFCGEPDI